MRVFIAIVLGAIVASVVGYFGGERYALNLVMVAVVVGLIRAHPNWRIGLGMVVGSLPFLVAGLSLSMLFPAHTLLQALLLDPSISRVFTNAKCCGVVLQT